MGKIIKIILLIFLTILIIILGYYLFLYFSDRAEYNDIFPNEPKIKDITNPLPIKKNNLRNVNFPFLTDANSFLYFDNKSIITKVDLNSSNFERDKQSIIFLRNLDIESVLRVKWCNQNRLIVFQITPTSFPGQDGDDVMPGNLLPDEINKFVIDIETKKTLSLNPQIIDAVWNDTCDKIYYLTNDNSNDSTSLYDINFDNPASGKLLLDFNTNVGIPSTQNKTLNNYLYYFKTINNQNVLMRLDTTTMEQNPILNNLMDAVISPNNKYAFIERWENNDIISQIYNLEMAKVVYTFKYTILSDAITWNKNGNELYFQAGENLKMESSSTWAASYVFFKYNAVTNSISQLNNHIYTKPIVPLFYILDEINHRLYFSDFPKKELDFLDMQ